MFFSVLSSAAGLALLSAAAFLTSCAREEAGGDPDGIVTMSVRASVSGYSGLSDTRSDYDRINDVETVNVVRYAIYTGGRLVAHNETGEFQVSARKRYDLYAIANVSGWSYPSSEEALRRQTMPAPAIPSFATAGIPLAGCAENVKPGDHNFTSEIPLKRLFSLVRLDLTPPDGATVSDVVINSFYVTNQNAVLMPFGESFYAEGVSGCAKAADDATDGHAYRDEVPAELTKGRYFVYVPENCSFVSGRAITPSGFYLKGSYTLDGVKRTVDATTLIATGASATSPLVSGQCRRNALVTVSLYDLSSAAEEPWMEVDPVTLMDTMYVAEADSTLSVVIHNYAGGLTVALSDNLRVINAGDDDLFGDNGDGTATLYLRYGCLAEGDGTGTITVMNSGKAIKGGVITVRTKAPALKFDETIYELTNSVRSRGVGLSYRLGDGAEYESYDQGLYDELLDVRTEVSGEAKSFVSFKPTRVSLRDGVTIGESSAGEYEDALVARPASSSCGVAAAKAGVKLVNSGGGGSVTGARVSDWVIDSEAYVAQRKSFSFKILSYADDMTVSGSDNLELSTSVTKNSDGSATVKGTYGCLKKGTGAITVKRNGSAIGNGSRSVNVIAPTLVISPDRIVISGNHSSSTFDMYYKDKNGNKMTDFDDALYDKLIVPSAWLDDGQGEYEDAFFNMQLSLSGNTLSWGQAGTSAYYDRALNAGPIKSGLGVNYAWADIEVVGGGAGEVMTNGPFEVSYTYALAKTGSVTGGGSTVTVYDYTLSYTIVYKGTVSSPLTYSVKSSGSYPVSEQDERDSYQSYDNDIPLRTTSVTITSSSPNKSFTEYIYNYNRLGDITYRLDVVYNGRTYSFDLSRIPNS